MPDHRAAYGLVTDFDPFHRIEADTHALADAAGGRLTEQVPSCPGWTVADLAWHLTEVHAWWGALVAALAQDPAEVPEPVRPASDAELVPGLRSGAARLVGILRAAGPQQRVWTWAEQRNVAFVVRHQVHEAAVHRWDAANAVAQAVELDATAATDGVEEFLQTTATFRQKAAEPMGGSLELVATDTGLRWTVEEEEGPDGGVRWQRRSDEATPREHAVALRAPAADLLLYLYGRRRAAELQVTGQVRVAERFVLGISTD